MSMIPFVVNTATVISSKLLARNLHVTKSPASCCTLSHSPNAKLNKNILDRFLCLPIPECFSLVQYVWIDGTGLNLRTKSKTLEYIPDTHKECPNWTYRGNLTKQSTGKVSEALLVPIALYNDPFRRGNNKIALCDTYSYEGKENASNHRGPCYEAMCKIKDCEPLWGIEQCYTLIDQDGRPFGWPVMNGEPRLTHEYYCSVGAQKAYAREISECHYRGCLYAGIKLDGTNADCNQSQWEFRIGTCPAMKGPDDLWMARFILERVAEEYGVGVSYEPKMFPNWHSSSMHVSFSTKTMREDDGLKCIEEAIGKLSRKHKEHLEVYDNKCGEDNKRRLTGEHGTSCFDKFTSGVADASFSVRIPKVVADKKKGYFEDRRPAANCDPYQACNMIVRTCILD